MHAKGFVTLWLLDLLCFPYIWVLANTDLSPLCKVRVLLFQFFPLNSNCTLNYFPHQSSHSSNDSKVFSLMLALLRGLNYHRPSLCLDVLLFPC